MALYLPPGKTIPPFSPSVLITNFGVWTLGTYGYSLEGLIACYTLALPFFGNTIVSTLIFSSLIEIVLAKKELLKKLTFKI